MIRQYRTPFERFCWEVPAGTLDVPGEDALSAAQARTRRGTGLRSLAVDAARHVHDLTRLVQSTDDDLRGPRSHRCGSPSGRSGRDERACDGSRAKNCARLFDVSPRSTTPRSSPSDVSTEHSLTTSEAYLAEYLQWLTIEKGRSRATIEAYRRDLTKLLEWMKEHQRELETLRDADLERYCNQLRRQKRAETSIARSVASIRGWFAYLVVEGYLTSDPSARLRGGRRGRSLPKPLGEDEVTALLDSVPDASPIDLRDRALLELLYGTGARVSEVVGIGLERSRLRRGTDPLDRQRLEAAPGPDGIDVENSPPRLPRAPGPRPVPARRVRTHRCS